MKKKLSIIIVAVMLIFTFAFVGCKGGDPDTNQPTNNLSAKSDLLTVSAVSVGNMMGTFGPGAASVAEVETTVPTVDPVMQKINYYMSVVDGILGNEATSKSEDILDTDAEYGGKYTKKLTITTGSKEDGTEKSYILVYNEEALTDADKVSDDEEEEEDETEETETEAEFKISGLMIIDDATYIVEGKREIESETEGDETETEAEFEFKAYVANKDTTGELVKDESNYIDFKQEIEQEGTEVEQEFCYSVYKNGTLVKAFSLEIEKDPVDNETEVELEDNGLILKFETEVDANGKEYIEINADDNGEVFIVDVEVSVNENGDKVYKYSQEGKEDIELEEDCDEEDDD